MNRKGASLDLRDRLMTFLKEQDVLFTGIEPKNDTSLIRSGLLDSLALFNLALWVEREAGRPFDVTTLDLSREWDTVAGIVGFVETLKGERAHSNNGLGRPEGSSPEWNTKS